MADNRFSLDDLAPPTVTVDVTTEYGRSVSIVMDLMTYHEYMECALLVPDPKPPFNKLGEDGKTRVANYQDEKFVRDLAEARELREFVRLARAMRSHGDIPGNDLVAQGRALRDRMDSGLANALHGFLQNASLGGKADTQDSFRGVPGRGPEGDDTPAPYA